MKYIRERTTKRPWLPCAMLNSNWKSIYPSATVSHGQHVAMRKTFSASYYTMGGQRAMDSAPLTACVCVLCCAATTSSRTQNRKLPQGVLLPPPRVAKPHDAMHVPPCFALSVPSNQLPLPAMPHGVRKQCGADGRAQHRQVSSSGAQWRSVYVYEIMWVPLCWTRPSAYVCEYVERLAIYIYMIGIWHFLFLVLLPHAISWGRSM